MCAGVSNLKVDENGYIVHKTDEEYMRDVLAYDAEVEAERIRLEEEIRMGRIGEPQRHIEVEPLENPADAPVQEPAPQTVPSVPAQPQPEREPEEVPA